MSIRRWIFKNTESLKGKKIAVTGSTGGLGRELCAYIGSLGGDMILLDRNKEKSEQHKKELTERYSVAVECIFLDLEDIKSAGAAVERLKKEQIDVFVHNAGAYSVPRLRCDSGYGNIFQINFAAPYYMIRSLIPCLREKNGHVVAVGSIAHNYSKTDPDDVDFSAKKADSKVYGNAKRFLMFSLHKLFQQEKEVTLSIVHPGITFTNITAHYPKAVFAIIKHPMKIIFMHPRKAALSLLRGIFEATEYCTWIGPRFFGIWGKPKKQKLSTCSHEEQIRIFETAESVLAKCRDCAEGKKIQV